MAEYKTQRLSNGFNIDEFRAIRGPGDQGILRNNHFWVTIPKPTGFSDNRPLQPNAAYARTYANEMRYACETINIPQTGTAPSLVQRYGYGAVETRPTIPQFSPLQCTLICDKSAHTEMFFHEWVKMSCNFDWWGSGHDAPTTSAGYTLLEPYEISYGPMYRVSVSIQQFNEIGDNVRSMTFRDAYPTSVGDISLNWGRLNDIIRIPVTFAFTDWFEEAVDVSTPESMYHAKRAVGKYGEETAAK